jgi:hypothetical protein
VKLRNLILAALAVLALAGAVSACSVPVYRYALEHWQPERYLGYVFHKGPLAGDDEKTVTWLRARAEDDNVSLNLNLIDVNVDRPMDRTTAAVWERHRDAPLPRLVVRYPEFYVMEADVWAGPLTRSGVLTVVDSPARRSIAERLLAGDMLVWVLLESGDAKADDAAESLIKAQIEKLKTTLKLPEIQPGDVEPGAAIPELKVALSTLRLSRTDAREAAFLPTLLAGEPSLPTDKPVLFTVFGQGRVVFPASGAGINADVLQEIAEFVSGECSCIVKSQNPGMDVLMAANWSAVSDGLWVRPQQMPDLTGLPEQPVASQQVASPKSTDNAPPAGTSERLSVFNLSIIAVVAALIVAVVIVSIVLARRRES